MGLSHPNILRIYGFFSDGKYAAIAMEYVEGNPMSTLRGTRKKGVFDVTEISEWTRQACAALHYAHVEGELVHRDLKPANLMIDARGRLKVADFGIAGSLADAQTRLTGTMDIRGTLAYMSPQQLTGQRPCISQDIYGLGATLYDLLTGKPPFHTGDISYQVREVAPTTIAERRRELGLELTPVPPEWEATIMACLDKHAAKRPKNAAEVAERLGLSAIGMDSQSPYAPTGAGAHAPTEVIPSSAPTAVDTESFRIPARPLDEARSAPAEDSVAPLSGDMTRYRNPNTIDPLATGHQTQYSPTRSTSNWVLLSLAIFLITVIGGGLGAWAVFEWADDKAGPSTASEDIAAGGLPSTVDSNQPAADTSAGKLSSDLNGGATDSTAGSGEVGSEAGAESEQGSSGEPIRVAGIEDTAQRLAVIETDTPDTPPQHEASPETPRIVSSAIAAGSLESPPSGDTNAIQSLARPIVQDADSVARVERESLPSVEGSGPDADALPVTPGDRRGSRPPHPPGSPFYRSSQQSSGASSSSSRPGFRNDHPGFIRQTVDRPVSGYPFANPDRGGSFEMIWIPEGMAKLGTPSHDPGAVENEFPVTGTTLSQEFWIGKYEVTQAEYEQIMGTNPSSTVGSDLPVENVSWRDAMRFAERYTRAEKQAGRLPAGYVYSLPTEAQWEYAARSGEGGRLGSSQTARARSSDFGLPLSRKNSLQTRVRAATTPSVSTFPLIARFHHGS